MPRTPDNEDPTTGTPPVWGDRFGDSPERIGPYRFKREIGAGGMGVVYEAVHERLGRSVALKLIGREWTSAEMRRRFAQERDILSALRHPAVAHIYDAGEFEHEGEMLPYIVMEYIVGAKPVTKHFFESTVGVEGVLEVFEQLFDGLEHAHRRGIVHRDIKPGNILVDSEGRAKIIDFGLSLPTGARGAADSLHTERGIPAGTRAYMSPEQRTGDPLALDQRTDIYSMALVLYESLAGERPSQTESGLPDIRRAAPGLPRELAETITAALREFPAERTGSAGAVRDSLKEIRERMIVGTTVHTRVEPERTREGLARWALMAVAAAIGALVVLPLCCNALPFCAAYARWAAARIVGTDAEYQKVSVVSITEDGSFAALAGEGNDPLTYLQARRYYDDLMYKILEHQPDAIVWDLFFSDETEHDQDFAESINVAIERGVPVVLMTRMWTDDRPGSRVSPVLERTGAVVAVAPIKCSATEPWRLALAAQKGDGFVEPGLSLAAVALIGHAGRDLHTDIRTDDTEVVVRVLETDEPGRPPAVVDSQTHGVTGIRPIANAGGIISLSEDDVAAELMITVPSDEALGRATVPIEHVVGPEPVGGHSSDAHVDPGILFNNRIVVIGRTDEAGFDIADHPGGRRIAKCYANAEAIESLLRRRQISVPDDNGMRVLSALGAMLGVLCLFGGGRNTQYALVAVGSCVLAAVLGSYTALMIHWIVYPAPVVMSIVLGSVIGAVGWRLMDPVRRAAGL